MRVLTQVQIIGVPINHSIGYPSDALAIFGSLSFGHAMLYRYQKSIAQRAAIWLLAALFALPASFSPACPCSAKGQETVCDCDECMRQPSQFVEEESVSCCNMTATPLVPLCPCEENCPCRCQENQQPIRSVVLRQDSQDDLRAGEVQTEAVGVVELSLRSSAVSSPTSAKALSALQRCISLSRFAL